MTYDLRKILLGGLITLLFGYGAKQLSAQAIGSIRGTVVDSSQALVSGASVVAVNTATTVSRTEVSNQEGHLRLS